MGSQLGTMKVAAKRIGIPFDDYLAKVKSGRKWCHRCKRWRKVRSFGHDRTRYDGRDAVCLDCRTRRTAPGPSTVERRMNLSLGLKWCGSCSHWVAADKVHGGKCQPCKNADDRRRYASDLSYRAARQQHAISRKRGVDAVPAGPQFDLLELFDGRCAYCPSPATTWDHIHPVSRNGKTEQGNIVPCCRSCNSAKRDADPDEWNDTRLSQCHPALVDILVIGHERQA